MHKVAFAFILASPFALGSCTTLSSGIAVAPPGVSPFSFRECLLDKGFYSHQALTGIASDDWRYRHTRVKNGKLLHPLKPAAGREDLLEQSAPEFVARASAIIANGLMPAVEFRGQGLVPGQKTFDRDRGVNLPYVPLRGPDPYPEPGMPAVNAVPSPPTGDPPGPDWRLNRFLDCYIAPVGPAANAQALDDASSNSTAGDADTEGRLLRGHILLALIAQFGTQLVVSHSGSRQVAQAELLLGHIADAEKSLRSASMILNSAHRAKLPADAFALADASGPVVYDDGNLVEASAAHAAPHAAAKAVAAGELQTLTLYDLRGSAQLGLSWYGFATRLLRVFQVGVDAERIDARQSLDRAANLVAAFGGAINGFLPILKDGLSGFVAVQKTRIYGDAYLRDARETLRTASTATRQPDPNTQTFTYDVPTFRHGWHLWDEELDKACKVLATIARRDDSNAECVPDLDAPASKPKS